MFVAANAVGAGPLLQVILGVATFAVQALTRLRLLLRFSMLILRVYRAVHRVVIWRLVREEVSLRAAVGIKFSVAGVATFDGANNA